MPMDKYEYKISEIQNKQSFKTGVIDKVCPLFLENDNTQFLENTNKLYGLKTFDIKAKFEWKRKLPADYYEFFYQEDGNHKYYLENNNKQLFIESKRIDEFEHSIDILPKSEYNAPLDEIKGVDKITTNIPTDVMIKFFVEDTPNKYVSGTDELYDSRNDYYEDNLSGHYHKDTPVLYLEGKKNTFKYLNNGVYESLRDRVLPFPKYQLNGGYVDYKISLNNQLISFKNRLWDNFSFADKPTYLYYEKDTNKLFLENTNDKYSTANVVLDNDSYKTQKLEMEQFNPMFVNGTSIPYLDNNAQASVERNNTKFISQEKHKPIIEEFKDESSDELVNNQYVKPTSDVFKVYIENDKHKYTENTENVYNDTQIDDNGFDLKRTITIKNLYLENTRLRYFNSVVDAFTGKILYPDYFEHYRAFKYEIDENDNIQNWRQLLINQFDLIESVNDYFTEDTSNQFLETNWRLYVSNGITELHNTQKTNIVDYVNYVATEHNKLPYLENTDLRYTNESISKYKNVTGVNINDEYNDEIDERGCLKGSGKYTDDSSPIYIEGSSSKFTEKTEEVYASDREFNDNFNYNGVVRNVKQFYLENTHFKYSENGSYRNNRTLNLKYTDYNKFNFITSHRS
jgi:hypothetical protein